MNLDRNGRIGFQGEPGANSDTASREMFPNMEPLPCDTFEDVFGQLERGNCDLAMIPIENSLAGRVADIHHLLPGSNTHIIGEYFLPIHFHLMAPKGAKIEGVKTVYSHVHALGQCRKVISELGLNAIVAADTAGSARMVSQKGDDSCAALAPKLAAELYELDILRENVEDADHNTTRFVVLSKTPEVPEQGGPVMTSFVFQVRSIPAALYKAMGGFATNRVNMTKLESYMLDGNFFATQFFAEVEGHPEDENVKLAFEELQFFCNKFDILGVYPASVFRT